MRKYKIAALALLICLSLVACTTNETPADTQDPTTAPTPEATDAPVTEAPEPTDTPEPTPAPTFAIDTDRQDSIYNQDSVSAVFLGMSKSELEAIFTPGELTDNGYTPYDDYGFFVKYYGNDTVKELVIFEKDSWETFNGISCGATVAQLVEAYGEPLSDEDGVYAYYTLNNELLKEAPNLTEVDINYLYNLDFIIEDGIVSCVMLSRF